MKQQDKWRVSDQFLLGIISFLATHNNVVQIASWLKPRDNKLSVRPQWLQATETSST